MFLLVLCFETKRAQNSDPLADTLPQRQEQQFMHVVHPHEKDKLYKTQDLGVEFAKSDCIATYGSWLLMQDPRYNLHIINIFNRERIDLPSVESQHGMVKERTIEDWFRISQDHIRSPVFWIDEKTKDYVVLWGLGSLCVVYSKKGYNLWNKIPEISDCVSMVYKDHKLYFFSFRDIFTILDFSGEVPQQTFQCGVLLFDIVPPCYICVVERKLVVTVTGVILNVEKVLTSRSSYYCSFRVFKVYSPGFLKNNELIHSLDDESMFYDQGITVLASDTNGFIRNSIYFSGYYGVYTNDISLFDLKTQKTKLLYTFDRSSVQLSSARSRWFLPNFTLTT